MERNKQKMGQRTKKRLIFFLCMIILPLTQTAFFYIGVNVNSFIKAFQLYSVGQSGYEIVFAGIENFKSAIECLSSISYMVKNSFTVFFVKLLIAMPLSWVFSFYIYKKKPLSGFFKVILFLPQIISGLIFSLLFKYAATDVFVYVVKQITGEEQVLGLLDRGADIQFTVILIYSIAISFGANIILYSGTMSAIDESIVESAHLDGVNVFQEFVHITLPLIYPTIVSFVVIAVGAICTDQMNLFSMYGIGAQNIGTLGYYLYYQAQSADVIYKAGHYSFGQLSALSIILSIIVVPSILGLKSLLNKVGPSVE